MAKIKGNGKASVWTDEDLLRLLSLDLIAQHPDRVLMMAILRYTGERIGAVLQLRVADCYDGKKPRKEILFRKRNRKGLVQAREVMVCHKLADYLNDFSPSEADYLFPSPVKIGQPITYSNVWRWLNLALQKVELSSAGYSTHSFRRTFTTKLSKKLPLAELQELTGHKSLDVLRGYIEPDEQAISDAINSL